MVLDSNKDQSYFLYTLAMSRLRKACSRSANWKIRRCGKIAKIWSGHREKDSTGICFIGERKFREFLCLLISGYLVQSLPSMAMKSVSTRG
ncbi:hypothetical protein ACNKHL_06935 [Shigella flexneri]